MIYIGNNNKYIVVNDFDPFTTCTPTSISSPPPPTTQTPNSDQLSKKLGITGIVFGGIAIIASVVLGILYSKCCGQNNNNINING